jgi:hypothetical protein
LPLLGSQRGEELLTDAGQQVEPSADEPQLRLKYLAADSRLVELQLVLRDDLLGEHRVILAVSSTKLRRTALQFRVRQEAGLSCSATLDLNFGRGLGKHRTVLLGECFDVAE